MKIPLIRPYITEEIKEKVCEVLDSGYLTEGPVTRQFEDCVKDYIGCSYAVAVCNCTVGLELALRALGIRPGDEVIVPDYTYPATAAVVEIVGAKIVLVDIDPANMLIDYDAIEKAITGKTKVIIPVSIFGNPLDYKRLGQIKEKYNLYVLEDAACSIGARFDGVHVGNLADITVFSFHPRKFITTGEGGMVTTNNAQMASWMDSYKHFGIGPNDSRLGTQFDRIGTNFKLSNIQAAIGLTQMRYIDVLLDKRRQLAERYNELIETHLELQIPQVTPKGTHSWQSYCIFTPNRNQTITRLRKKNIETQIGTYSLHLHKAYSQNSNCRIVGDMAGSRNAFDHCLTLPLYHEMTAREQELVVSELLRSIQL